MPHAVLSSPVPETGRIITDKERNKLRARVDGIIFPRDCLIVREDGYKNDPYRGVVRGRNYNQWIKVSVIDGAPSHSTASLTAKSHHPKRNGGNA